MKTHNVYGAHYVQAEAFAEHVGVDALIRALIAEEVSSLTVIRAIRTAYRTTQGRKMDIGAAVAVSRMAMGNGATVFKAD